MINLLEFINLRGESLEVWGGEGEAPNETLTGTASLVDVASYELLLN